MYNFCKKVLFFLSVTIGAVSAHIPTQYDFFKESSIRIHEASKHLKNAYGFHDGNFYAVQNAAQSGSLQELAMLYPKLITAMQTKVPQGVSANAEAAYVVLFLEKMRDCYYTHLDCIEAALPYWEWAKHHPHRYTVSQLPHKWLKHEANQIEVDHIYTMIMGLRDVCSKEFGIIVRLLAAWHEGHIDVATWLANVRTTMISIIPGTKIDALQTTESLIQGLSEHEENMVKMVASVQKPQWLKRNWIPALTGTVLAGIAAYYYVHNQQSVHSTIAATQSSLLNFWEGQIAKKIGECKDALLAAMKPVEPVDNTQGNGIATKFDSADKALKELKYASDKSYITGNWISKEYTKPIFDVLTALLGVVRDISVKVDKNLDAVNHNIESYQINFALGATFPACLIMYGMGKGTQKTYNWFTKRDRSTLIRRLRQAQRVVVRTEHARALSDAEYGQMLYLLSKAHDQVAANVFSDERIEFLNDLTYVADAQSSTEQKRETLKIMFDRFRSLEKPA